MEFNAAVFHLGSFFLRYNRIGSRRDGGAGEDAGDSVGFKFSTDVAGKNSLRNREIAATACKIGAANGIAVHLRIIQRRDFNFGDDVLGEDLACRIKGHHIFYFGNRLRTFQNLCFCLFNCQHFRVSPSSRPSSRTMKRVMGSASFISKIGRFPNAECVVSVTTAAMRLSCAQIGVSCRSSLRQTSRRSASCSSVLKPSTITMSAGSK